MTEYQKIRNSVVGVPVEQIVNKAGEISSTVDDITLWDTVSNGAEPDLKIDDGKLALSTSAATTIENAENITRFQKLWNRSPAAWKSGSDLVIPATAVGTSEIASGTITSGDADYVMNYGQWFATREGNNCTLRFYFSFTWTNPADTTPASFAFDGLPSSMYIQSGGGNPDNKCLSIPVNDSVNGYTVTTIFPRNSINFAIYRTSSLSGFTGIGTMLTGHTSIGQSCSISYDVTNRPPTSGTTPIIYIADNVLSSSLGLPVAGAESKGLVSFGDINEVLENEAVNGSFDFNQRGAASYTVTTEYTLDRYRLDVGNSSTNTVTQEQFAIGQTEVSGNPKNYLRATSTTGGLASSFSIISTRLEDVAKFSGEWVTVGVDLKADATKDISIEFVQSFGSGGSPSASVEGIEVNKLTIGDTWQRYYVTAFIPSISGKTLGSNGNDYFQVLMWFDAGSDYDARSGALGNQSGTFEIANLDIKRTKNITPFTRAGGTYAGELALCQRYYVDVGQGGAGAVTPMYGYRSSGTVIYGVFMTPVQMRSAPTIINTSNINYYFSDETGLAAATFSAIGDPRGCYIPIRLTVASSTGSMWTCRVSTGKLALDCEL